MRARSLNDARARWCVCGGEDSGLRPLGCSCTRVGVATLGPRSGSSGLAWVALWVPSIPASGLWPALLPRTHQTAAQPLTGPWVQRAAVCPALRYGAPALPPRCREGAASGPVQLHWHLVQFRGCVGSRPWVPADVRCSPQHSARSDPARLLAQLGEGSWICGFIPWLQWPVLPQPGAVSGSPTVVPGTQAPGHRLLPSLQPEQGAMLNWSSWDLNWIIRDANLTAGASPPAPQCKP